MYKLPGGGKRYEKLPRNQWIAYKENAHASYISYEEFEENRRVLQINAQSYGADRRNGPPRELTNSHFFRSEKSIGQPRLIFLVLEHQNLSNNEDQLEINLMIYI